MHKQSAQRALQFLENNYIMINSLESKVKEYFTQTN